MYRNGSKQQVLLIIYAAATFHITICAAFIPPIVSLLILKT